MLGKLDCRHIWAVVHKIYYSCEVVTVRLWGDFQLIENYDSNSITIYIFIAVSVKFCCKHLRFVNSEPYPTLTVAHMWGDEVRIASNNMFDIGVHQTGYGAMHFLMYILVHLQSNWV